MGNMQSIYLKVNYDFLLQIVVWKNNTAHIFMWNTKNDTKPKHSHGAVQGTII